MNDLLHRPITVVKIAFLNRMGFRLSSKKGESPSHIHRSLYNNFLCNARLSGILPRFMRYFVFVFLDADHAE